MSPSPRSPIPKKPHLLTSVVSLLPQLKPDPPQTLSNIRSLTSSLTGLTAGTLGLSSLAGFAFYLLQHLLVSLLIHFGPGACAGNPDKYFYAVWGDLWGGEVVGGLMGFVLTWTLGYNLVGA